MPAVSDSVWSAQGTTPDDDRGGAAASCSSSATARTPRYVPARALNLVCVVDKRVERRDRQPPAPASAATTRRARSCCAVEAERRVDRRGRDDRLRRRARAPASSRCCARPSSSTSASSTSRDLDTIVDPLVVTDLPTVAVVARTATPRRVEALLPLAQVVLLDSVDQPDVRVALDRACDAAASGVYVVDLAWLRSTPWRERVAATFDPPHLRAELRSISARAVRHHPESRRRGRAARRLARVAPGLAARARSDGDGTLIGTADGRRQEIELALEPDADLQVRGLAGLTLETGVRPPTSSSTAGPAACRRTTATPAATSASWTVLGASRGESGILGEGIRQALLRDPTYDAALTEGSKLIA